MLNITANGRDEVIDVTDATFIAEVLEVSKVRPVLVDFWAPWCAPCRALGPVLEKAVAATEGRVRLVKVNVDENQVFARKLQVQSIPAVFAFHGGHPVDGFMGNLAPSRIAEFVARLIERSDPDRISVEDALAAAEEMMEAGNAVDAMEVYAQLLEQDPECLPAIAGMVTAQLKVGQLEMAREMIRMVPVEKRTDDVISAAIARIDVAEQSQRAAGEMGAKEAALAADPSDHQARFDLALAKLAAGDREGAVDELLELFRRDREWNDGAAKAQLFKLFESFGPKDPLTLKGRRRLSSMIYA